MQSIFIIRPIPMCLLYWFLFLATTLSAIENGMPGRDSDDADFKVCNEFAGGETKPWPVVATPNLILMMLKAATTVPYVKKEDDEDTKIVVPKEDEWRMDRFYYCGPKNGDNSCRSLCYSFGYPRITCGRVSCYCTW